jgi:hypothetical protein
MANITEAWVSYLRPASRQALTLQACRYLVAISAIPATERPRAVLYVYYSRRGKPVVLPQILTDNTLLSELDRG